MLYFIRDIHEFSYSSVSLQAFKIFFELNGYFYLRQLLQLRYFWQLKAIFFGIFYQNPSQIQTDWLIFEGLATKNNLNQLQKYLAMGLLGQKPNFWTPSYSIQEKVMFNPT
jgi:hypothetical protein